MGDPVRFYARDRASWRRWLEKNHAKAAGVWLVRHKVKSKKRCVSYEDSVLEALCFGWIDGKERSVDDEQYLQLFTPRRAKSTWAATNKARVKTLIAEGLMTSAGLAVIERAKADGSWNALDDIDAMVVPDDLAKALARNKTAGRNFDAYSASVKKGLLYWIASAKRPETRAKRIAETVKRSAVNWKPGDPT